MSQRQIFRKAMFSPPMISRTKSPRTNVNLTNKNSMQQQNDESKHRKCSFGNFSKEIVNLNVNLNFNLNVGGDPNKKVNLNTSINLNTNTNEQERITLNNYKNVGAMGQSLYIERPKKDKVPSFLTKNKQDKEVYDSRNRKKAAFSRLDTIGKFIGPDDPFATSASSTSYSYVNQFDRFPIVPSLNCNAQMRKKIKTQNSSVYHSYFPQVSKKPNQSQPKVQFVFTDLQLYSERQDNSSKNFKKYPFNATATQRQWPCSMHQIGEFHYQHKPTVEPKSYREKSEKLDQKFEKNKFCRTKNFEYSRKDQLLTQKKVEIHSQKVIKEHQKAKQWKIDDFQLFDKIGKGAYGDVFLARQNISGFVCVIKKLSKKRIKQQNIQEHVVRQIKIQSYLSHRHLTNLYGFFSDENYIYIILELITDGNICHFIKRKKKVSESLAGHLIKQVIECLRYMHTENIIHRDLKPQNIFIHEDYIKVGDLGCAVECNNLRNTVVGCLAYVSPQQLQYNGYDQKIDIWSVGILTYELLIGRPPFQDDVVQIAKGKKDIKLSKLEFPKTDSLKQVNEISDEAKDFIEQLLQEDPKDRINMKNALRHPFLKKSEKDSGLIFQEINMY